MRRALIVAFVLTNFGCSATFAGTPDCRAIFAGCMKACSTDQQCQSNCYEGVGLCLKVAGQGNKPFFRGAGTAVGAASAPAMIAGAKNINPGTASTATMDAAPLSAPAKPPVAVSNGMPGHASGGQPGRSNVRAQ